MSILATDNKLISFGTDYSAGSGISIIDHTISVTGEFGKTYSAGPNIGIYDVSGQPTISSKDWSSDIANASANAYEQAVSQIPEPQDLSYISATVDKNTSGIDYISSVCLTSHKDWTDTIKDASANSYTQSTSYFNDWINGQYTGDITDITNNLTALSGDLSSYYKKTETSSKEQINDALQYVSANAGKVYEGISPIVVNNDEDKISADTWTLSAGEGVSFTDDSANKVTRIDVTAQGGNCIPYTAVDEDLNVFETSSGLKFRTNKDGELQSNFINKDFITLSYFRSPLGVYDKATLNTGSLTFENKYESAYVDIGKIHTWDSASNYIQTISSTYYPKSNPSSFATESWVTAQGYLTAHQDISNKLDSSAFSSVSGDFLTTSFSIPESATWNDTSNVVQTNSAQWAEGGGGSVSSKYGTISVDGSNIEATNKAIEFNSNGFTSSFDDTSVQDGFPVIFTWDAYSQGTRVTAQVYNNEPQGDATLTYSSNTNVTGEVTGAPFNIINLDLQIPNATAIQFSADKNFRVNSIRVSAISSLQVRELAWKSDLPTYAYNSNKKVSAINGSALVGNEDYLVEQGFVQNLTSPKGTVSVFNNSKIECTNSAIASDAIEGFVSSYNGESVYPGNSATLTWDRYVPNTMLFISGAEEYWQEYQLTYSADTSVTGVITVPARGQASIELPTDSKSIVIGNGNWNITAYNFTVSADNYYEIGELAWASALPTYEYDSTNKISAINGSALAAQQEVSHDNTLSGNGTVDSPLGLNETTLYESASGTKGNTNITLSESISNFEYVQIDYSVWDDEKATQILPVQSSQYQLNTVWFDGNSNFYHFCDVLTISGTAYTLIKAAFHNFNSTSVTVDGDAKKLFKTYKVIGINRISGSNA